MIGTTIPMFIAAHLKIRTGRWTEKSVEYIHVVIPAKQGQSAINSGNVKHTL